MKSRLVASLAMLAFSIASALPAALSGHLVRSPFHSPLHQIASSIVANSPEVHLIILLTDERPEGILRAAAEA